jgi:hypothetical protein
MTRNITGMAMIAVMVMVLLITLQKKSHFDCRVQDGKYKAE